MELPHSNRTERRPVVASAHLEGDKGYVLALILPGWKLLSSFTILSLNSGTYHISSIHFVYIYIWTRVKLILHMTYVYTWNMKELRKYPHIIILSYRIEFYVGRNSTSSSKLSTCISSFSLELCLHKHVYSIAFMELFDHLARNLLPCFWI